ncbi:NAD(P)-dependent dehydrogenase, short-chain alcohol dehydrogenase family [Solimonas aquatica]|uniref:NAD(P)-dependent dehydrogenase, short-chain alcohol dehydrogenase family n=1 Tax=Solimonas aquatica TaxID=489703 RepID=A0A1H9EIA0_9GAMM|nr:SDR family oxidoreductase [Solimonas aquatica]SEQ25454.1 NAD(P)-dependent dehydrogenase, short-chain alcohol dehydrogenase family [Solimonas aquatica]
MRLQGQVALVTGAGQGVGQGIAYALASEGAAVALLGRTAAKLEQTAAGIEKRGARALVIAADIKQAETLAAAVAQTVAQLGGIQILVNNAQEVPLGKLLEVSEASVEAGWQSGPMATLRLMKLCYPHLKARGGSIVNLATPAAKRWDLSGYGAYAAVKEAIRQLTRAAACEWGGEGIRANAILPLADSPAMAWWTRERPQEASAFLATVPQHRVGSCEQDIGRFVALLCSADCAYVNGQSIALDGGQVFLG